MAEKDKQAETDQLRYRRYINLAVSQWELYPYSNSVGAGVVLQYALLIDYCSECLVYMAFAAFNSQLFSKKFDLKNAVEYLQYARKLESEESFSELYSRILEVYLQKGWDTKVGWLSSCKGIKSKIKLKRLDRIKKKYIDELISKGICSKDSFVSWKGVNI